MNRSATSFLLLPIVLAGIWSAGPVSAGETFIVDSLLDDFSEGTLRKEIFDAAMNGMSDDIIEFAPTLAGETITVGLNLGISEDLTLDASALTEPVTISGGGSTRILFISSAVDVTIRKVNFVDGRGQDGTSGLSPTGGFQGGAIFMVSGVSLTTYDCTFANNRAGDGGENTGMSGAGVNGAPGGAIFANSGCVVTAIGCTFTGNAAGNGGNSNPVGGSGSSGGLGGAIFGFDSTFTFLNTTFSSNSAGNSNTSGATNGAGGSGGAIYSSQSTVNLVQCTVIDNSAGNSSGSGAPGGSGGGIYNNASSTLNVRNSLVAGNAAGTTLLGSDGTGDDIFQTGATVNSLGNNLIGSNETVDTTFLAGFPNGNGDLVGTPGSPVDPKLGPLADNGGCTLTHAPLLGSPAIDRGDNAEVPTDMFDIDGDMDTAEKLPLDQRLGSRVVGGRVDIGAVEDTVTFANRILKSKLTRKIKKLTKRVKKLKRKGKTTAVKRLKKKIRKLKKRVRRL